MNNLPFDIVDTIFEYLPLDEIITNSALNEQCREVAERHIKRRCAISFNLSFIAVHRAATILPIFDHIGAHLRELSIDVPCPQLMASVVQRCPNLDTLIFGHALDHECDYDLSGIKSLTFADLVCYDQVLRTYFQRCSGKLETLIFKEMGVIGMALVGISTSIRYLEIRDSYLGLDLVNNYPHPINNPQSMLRSMRLLRTLGYALTLDKYELLAQLPNLRVLKINIISLSFYEFPAAIDDASHHLAELYIEFAHCSITRKFAECMNKFKHLIKLTLSIGDRVNDSKELLGTVGHLAEHGRLHTVVLTGHVNYLELDNHRAMLSRIKDLRIVNIG